MAELVCACEDEFRSVCDGLPTDNEHEGEHYCVLHLPSADKNLAGFEKAIEKKLKDKDFDFRGIYFPRVAFSEATFEGEANFSSATFEDRAHFREATFEEKAYFSGATFEGGVDFRGASFEGEAAFFRATFIKEKASLAKEAATFSETTFKDRAGFIGATFEGEATFFGATFEGGVDFRGATLEGGVEFDRATFEGGADFAFGLTFEGEATFFGATFEGWAIFLTATFEEGADFHEATFKEEANFIATFKERANFSGATFNALPKFSRATFEGEANFSSATFEGGADFHEATFKDRAGFIGATFEREATFHEATFEGGVDFRGASFEGRVAFLKATFKERAGFIWVTFEGDAGFHEATFEGEADFYRATFKEKAYFPQATFKEGAVFWSLQTSPQTFLTFRAAVAENPERFSFHSTPLRPSYFIDVDAQKFDFSDVQWFTAPHGDERKLEDEIKATEEIWEDIKPPRGLRKLQKACRNLMNNAEENRDYPTANEFHYWSMELLRKEGWRRLGLIGTLYWALSGYGERPRRAFWVLVGMWILFAVLYMVVGHKDLQIAVQAFSGTDIRQGIEHALKALVYSLAAIARLNPEPKPPAPGPFQLLVTFEGLLGPLQIALLALAVRRKVMR